MTYQALAKYEREYFDEVFDGEDRIDVLEDDHLAFITAKNGRRFIITGSNFVAYAENKSLAHIESSIRSQSALSKILAEVGLINADRARRIVARNTSYLMRLEFGDADRNGKRPEKTEEGNFYRSKRLHLPNGLCSGGHVPAGLKCLQRLLPVQYRSLIFLRTGLGRLQFNLLLNSHGGKVGPTDHTPIETDCKCRGVPGIGKFKADPCPHGEEAGSFCMMKAEEGPKHPLFGHIVCDKCHGLANNRLASLVEDATALGVDKNRLLKLQPRISATLTHFANAKKSSPPTDDELTGAMQEVGRLSGKDVKDENLCKLMMKWVQNILPRKVNESTGRTLCNREGCTNRAVQGGVCQRHGAKVKKCSYEGCSNQSYKGGVCWRHAAKKPNCSHDGCKNQARKGGVCGRHGAKDKT